MTSERKQNIFWDSESWKFRGYAMISSVDYTTFSVTANISITAPLGFWPYRNL